LRNFLEKEKSETEGVTGEKPTTSREGLRSASGESKRNFLGVSASYFGMWNCTEKVDTEVKRVQRLGFRRTPSFIQKYTQLEKGAEWGNEC